MANRRATSFLLRLSLNLLAAYVPTVPCVLWAAGWDWQLVLISPFIIPLLWTTGGIEKVAVLVFLVTLLIIASAFPDPYRDELVVPTVFFTIFFFSLAHGLYTAWLIHGLAGVGQS